MIREFVGWIDVRDLKKVKKSKKDKNKFLFPSRHLTIYDKHWYDGYCRKVKIKVLTKQK